MKKFTLFAAITAFTFSSCERDSEVSPVFTGYSYAPGNTGHEVIYDVDSIIKNDFNGRLDTFHFQVREVIESIFNDNQGRPTMRLERYKRLTPADPWVIYKVWTANLTSTNFEKKEDNITYIKLVFPPNPGKTWNGNNFNTLEKQDYKYTSLNVPNVFNSLPLDSTLTVLQYEDENIFSKVHYEERYATGVGMYYKLQDSIYYNCCSGNPQIDTIIYRRLYTEKIVSYIK